MLRENYTFFSKGSSHTTHNNIGFQQCNDSVGKITHIHTTTTMTVSVRAMDKSDCGITRLAKCDAAVGLFVFVPVLSLCHLTVGKELFVPNL